MIGWADHRERGVRDRGPGGWTQRLREEIDSPGGVAAKKTMWPRPRRQSLPAVQAAEPQNANNSDCSEEVNSSHVQSLPAVQAAEPRRELDQGVFGPSEIGWDWVNAN